MVTIAVAGPAAEARRRGRTRGLRLLPLLTLLALLGPVAAGLLGTIAPAFGYLPAIGALSFTPEPMRDLLGWPGLGAAVRLSLTTGVGATAASLAIVVAIGASWQGTRVFALLQRALSPLLAVPHAAAAFGLAFLIAPSGWLARLASPWGTGWERPPDLLVVQDPWGLALTAGLIAKEVPFLLLVTIAALAQADSTRSLTTARALGYRREAAWLKTVFPRVYAQIRLPVYVVLAFSMSVVDVAMILGPNAPPTLSVQIVRWMGDPDLALRLRAAAGSLLQLALVLGTLGFWRIGERAVAALGGRWLEGGGRGGCLAALRPVSIGLAGVSAASVLLGFAVLALWSLAGFWSFPDALPELTLRTWSEGAGSLARPLRETAIIAGAATALALVLAIGCLEAEARYGLRMTRRALWLLYLPLVVPQIAFLPGLQTLMLQVGVDSGRGAVIAAHLVFVLPYVFLSLGDPFRAWDGRYGTVARSLGTGPDGVLWRVRLPMLLAPVLTAAAVGFAVSVGQYLPTLMIGAGRVATLTTEAVALASGGDRRVIGLFALTQTGAALVPFALALALPRLVWANRRGLRHG